MSTIRKMKRNAIFRTSHECPECKTKLKRMTRLGNAFMCPNCKKTFSINFDKKKS